MIVISIIYCYFKVLININANKLTIINEPTYYNTFRNIIQFSLLIYLICQKKEHIDKYIQSFWSLDNVFKLNN
jgi:hypothetical protein